MQKVLRIIPNLLAYTAILLLGTCPTASAQQCSGSFGDPVINITFGSGANPGPQLKAAATGYSFTYTTCPADGFYTVTNSSLGCFDNTWHSLSSDHTGKPQGYFMLINASYTPSDFYVDTVKGLCASTTYRFGAWIANMLVPSACGGSGIMPNITFSIETTAGVKLDSFNTGNISATSNTSWQQYGLDFTVPAGITDVVLRMRNNAVGGCGNDLALDDITFSPCGPKAQAGIASASGSNSTFFCIDAQSSVQFSGAVSTGYGDPHYQWQVSTDTGATWTDIPGATTTTYNRPPSATAGLYQYRMAVGDGGNVLLPTCRVASNIITITVWPIPVPAASNDGPDCEGVDAALTATDGVTYSWSGPNGYIGSGAIAKVPNITTASAGVYTVTVTNGGGCTKTDQTTLSVIPGPKADFTYTHACAGSAANYTDQSTVPSGQSILKWLWTWPGDSVQGPNPAIAIGTDTGTYLITLTVTTDKGCASSKSRYVTYAYPPSVRFGVPEVCLADPASAFQFTDSSTIVDGSQSAFVYHWVFGDPNANPANPDTSNVKNPIHQYNAAGFFKVQLYVTSSGGCQSDTTESFYVNGANPQPAFDVNTGVLCSNLPVVLTDHSSVSPGNLTKTDIYWDYQNDPTIQTEDQTPAAGRQYAHTYPGFSSPATRNFEVRYIVYSGQTCMKELKKTVTINASPVATFGQLAAVCEEVPAYQITAGGETAGFTGTGSYSGRGIGSDGTFTPTVAGAGLDTLVYTFTAGNGCSDTASQSIRIYPQPSVSVPQSEYFLEGGMFYLDASANGNGLSYSWSPADSIIGDPHTLTPKVSPHEDITYTLTVTSADGCTNSAQTKVFVLKIPVIPNAFSPNGDGINDTWVIRYLDQYPKADIQVFNRYGQQVFHEYAYTRPWDGTYNGNPLPIGTYYYIIDPGSGRKRFSGSVTIIR